MYSGQTGMACRSSGRLCELRFVEMRKVQLVLFMFLLYSFSLRAQSNFELGLFAGTSQYLGDINKEKLFYSPSFSGAAFYRYVFNPRYALKTQLTWTPVKGNDLDFNNAYQQERGEGFHTNITDMSIQFEFNFLDYSYSVQKMAFSPYVSGGLGIAMMKNERGLSTRFIIPFGLGAKLKLSRRLSMVGLWEFRKSFTDMIDGYSFPESSEISSGLHNNDWYYIVGISLSYKINYYKLLCPAYDD